MNPIASYSDKSHFGRREYDLFPDNIAIRYSDTIKASGESVIRLSDLSPNYHRGAQRSQFFFAGIWMMLVPWLIYWALIELTKIDSLGVFAGFFLAMGFAGFFMVIVGVRKQQFVTFQTLAGVPALTIFREGPRKQEFDTFLALLLETMNGLKQTK
jgi:hypothetical protein